MLPSFASMREEKGATDAQIYGGGSRVPIIGGRIPTLDVFRRGVGTPDICDRCRNCLFDGDLHVCFLELAVLRDACRTRSTTTF